MGSLLYILKIVIKGRPPLNAAQRSIVNGIKIDANTRDPEESEDEVSESED